MTRIDDNLSNMINPIRKPDKPVQDLGQEMIKRPTDARGNDVASNQDNNKHPLV